MKKWISKVSNQFFVLGATATAFGGALVVDSTHDLHKNDNALQTAARECQIARIGGYSCTPLQAAQALEAREERGNAIGGMFNILAGGAFAGFGVAYRRRENANNNKPKL